MKFDVLTSTFKSFLSTFSLSKFLLIFFKSLCDHNTLYYDYITITIELSFFNVFIVEHSFRLNFIKVSLIFFIQFDKTVSFKKFSQIENNIESNY